MITQSRKVLLAALAVTIVAAFAITSFPAEDSTKLTKQVSDEEFRQAQMQVLDLRTELNKLESEGAADASDSEEKRELESRIDRLMPILEKHQEQQFAKHYIEPARKAQMELAESCLWDGVARLGFDSYAVNLNTLTKTIEIVTNDPAKNEQVRALIGSCASEDIPVTLENGHFTVIDHSCGDQNGDCDPIADGARD